MRGIWTLLGLHYNIEAIQVFPPQLEDLTNNYLQASKNHFNTVVFL